MSGSQVPQQSPHRWKTVQKSFGPHAGGGASDRIIGAKFYTHAELEAAMLEWDRNAQLIV